MDNIISRLAKEFNVREQQVENTLKLVDEGNTIPFIARYRKEATGGLDDAILRDLYDRLVYLRGMEERRREITRLVEEQGKITPELLSKIQDAQTMTELEDIYRPYRPKRRTRATIAKEKGMEPLADVIWMQNKKDGTIEEYAQNYINPEMGVNTAAEAISLASDILAERISDDADHRKWIRAYTYRHGMLETKAAKEESSVYEMYYDYSEAVNRIVPHRILAINRGEAEKYLTVKVRLDEEKIIELI